MKILDETVMVIGMLFRSLFCVVGDKARDQAQLLPRSLFFVLIFILYWLPDYYS
jgi:hypothetical protein